MTAIGSLLLAIVLAAPGQAPQQSAGGTLEGLVVDAATGAPLKGAQVSVLQQLPSGVTTDASGAFEFIDIRPGVVLLTVSLKDYLPVTSIEQITDSREHRRVALIPRRLQAASTTRIGSPWPISRFSCYGCGKRMARWRANLQSS